MQPFAVRRVRIRVDSPHEAPGSVVLFVTEDGDLREVAERALEAEGYEVVAAAHAGHALLACLAGRHVDVLVTEWSLGDMAGPRLARRIRRYYPDLPVVYLANADTRQREGASTTLTTRLGASVLVRPFTRDDLVRHLATALAGAAA
jgi:CheY-like chemotaxis protein